MTPDDLDYLEKCSKLGVLQSPCLEIGYLPGHNSRQFIEERGIQYFSADLELAEGVDFQADFCQSLQSVIEGVNRRRFKTALALNLLEHTFDPIHVLDNIIALLEPDGMCVITTPVVWPLHDHPVDCWRINPNFYEQYCEQRGLTLIPALFEYLKYGPVRNNSKTYTLPPPSYGWKQLYSRVIHKVFNTSGRGMLFPSHISVGVVIHLGV